MAELDLQPVIIDGKKGRIAYFDTDGKMTTPDKATTAKVVFDHGGRLFLTRGDLQKVQP